MGLFDFFSGKKSDPLDSVTLIGDSTALANYYVLGKQGLIEICKKDSQHVGKLQEVSSKLREELDVCKKAYADNHHSMLQNPRIQTCGYGSLVFAGAKLLLENMLYFLSSDENATQPANIYTILMTLIVGGGAVYLLSEHHHDSGEHLKDRIKLLNMHIRQIDSVFKELGISADKALERDVVNSH